MYEDSGIGFLAAWRCLAMPLLAIFIVTNVIFLDSASVLLRLSLKGCFLALDPFTFQRLLQIVYWVSLSQM
jgi:hypothetical protein